MSVEGECRLGGECPCAHHYGQSGSTLDEARAEVASLRAQLDEARNLVDELRTELGVDSEAIARMRALESNKAGA